MSCIAVVTTLGSLEQAQAMARALVERQLAACAQIDEIRSCYRWDGQLRDEGEFRVTFKSTRECYAALEGAILALHSYQLPAVHAIELQRISPAYQAWIEASVRP